MPNTKTAALSSQKFVAIDSIRDGIVILKNGGLRAILMASSLNFDLKAADEQDAVIFQYQNALNALDFSVQFIVHSRRLNIEPYLDTLRERHKIEQNELMKIQISQYVDFVKSLVELSNVVTKTFYVAIPFNPSVLGKSPAGFLSSVGELFGRKKNSEKKAETEKEFLEHKLQLQQRVDTVSVGLQRIGVRSVQLNTEELIELYYGLYNPMEANVQKVNQE